MTEGVYKTTEIQRARMAKYLNSEKGKVTRLQYRLSGRSAANSRKHHNKPEVRERRRLQGAEWYRNHRKLKVAIYSSVADF